jgi:hypothetical protein
MSNITLAQLQSARMRNHERDSNTVNTYTSVNYYTGLTVNSPDM